MRSATPGFVVAAVALLAACANPERSRDLANPAVSATTLAQQMCSNCHGMKGSATPPNFPNLAGQTESYFVAQLIESDRARIGAAKHPGCGRLFAGTPAPVVQGCGSVRRSTTMSSAS